MSTSDWKAIGAKKRQSVQDKIPQEWRLPAETLAKATETSDLDVTGIPRECGILTADEVAITENYDATALVEKMAAGEYTSLAVTTAFCKRAAIAQQLTSCCTELFFDEALERAKYLDEYLAKEKKPMGPLHGLPISIKDSFNYIGQETTLGFVSFVGKKIATDHSALVKMLLELGAVLYVKTNIPQTLMTADSENHVFGRSLNPHKLTLNAGGSSGGEGAIVGLRASILGVGTDIGGSIRIPALCNGTFGLRPSASRVPYGGQGSPGRAGSPGILAAAGPLTTSFRDVRLFMEAVINRQPWQFDYSVLHAPWRSAATKKETLKIGLLPADPSFPIHPPMQRALQSAVDKLKAAGHTIVPLGYVPSVAVANRQIADYYSVDPEVTPFKNIAASGEPKIKSVAESPFVSQRVGRLDMHDLFVLNANRAQVMAEWHNIWVTTGIDVVLGPGAETTAMPHDTFGNTPYTTYYNYLDYPAITIPYLKADKNIDVGEGFISYKKYNAENVHGAPTGIQVAARTLFDEELLDAAEIISKVLHE